MNIVNSSANLGSIPRLDLGCIKDQTTLGPITINAKNEDESPYDLTGVDIRGVWRKDNYEGKIVSRLDLTEEITVSDPLTGVITIAQIIPNWGKGNYFFDLRFDDDIYMEMTLELLGTSTYRYGS